MFYDLSIPNLKNNDNNVIIQPSYIKIQPDATFYFFGHALAQEKTEQY